MTLTTAPTPGDTQWFTHDRFGMFIHWGLYALPARHEWVKSMERIDTATYEKYFKHFDPDLYDPTLWAKAAADAGMKYFVITTKHHEGFCLWDTALTDYKATNTPYGKDLLRPMVEAFRGQNLKVGFYHSLLDWHHPDYTVDTHHPMRDNADYIAQDKNRDITRYVEYLHGQTRELLTQFGKVHIIWFDFSVGPSEKFPGKGKDVWQSEKLIKMVRELQPGILINDRLEIDQDIKTPEQYMPREWVRVNGQPVVWEACHTFSGSWGYHRDEESWKSVEMLVKMLIESVSKGGNLLLNVGPTGRGEFDARALDRLSGIGEWMKRHSRAIYGCTQAPDEFPCPQDCRYTYNPEKKRLYLHIFSWPFRHLHLDGMAQHVEYAQLLNDASEIKMLKRVPEASYGAMKESREETLLTLELPVKPPNVTVPVVELFLK
ncbi:MAG TPA: alpha-L-fucosidase [Chthonomonadaceae bacterium]|nr:alpha-L-fucosidase [Chthonomonadaceae bacterium]